MTSRPQLSLTAELEKLEQSITLTLQEIDHNFSKAHRIVTTSIIPIVERYAKESDAVWEGSKFWKQFFEASANVALSNYQEEEESYRSTVGAGENQHTYTTASSPGNYGDASTRHEADGHGEARQGGDGGDDDDDYLLDDSLLESLNLTGPARHSTPKVLPQRQAVWEDIDSPFDALRKELAGKDYTMHAMSPSAPATTTTTTTTAPVDHPSGTDDSIPPPPSTPQAIRQRQHVFETPDSSPFYPRKTPVAAGHNEDQLLHRVLDKNWRLQATPLGKPAPSRYRGNAATATPKPKVFPPPDSESPMPSPPKLRYYDDDDDIFSSPIKTGAPKTPVGKRPAMASEHPDMGALAGLRPSDHSTVTRTRRFVDDSDGSDDDFQTGFSPPKTIQFSLPPSVLLATPAREASRRIVHDILRTAGAADESSATENSPPVVRAMVSPGEDTF